MYYFTNFDPFNPPKPPAPEKKEAPPKPPAPPPPPPRMLILVGGGSECMVALPPKFEAAVTVAQEKFAVPTTHWVRLAVNRSDVPSWLGRYAEGEVVYIADDAAYQYIAAGKQVVILQVFVYDKGEAKPPAAAKAPSAPPAPPPGPPPVTSCALEVVCEDQAGKTSKLVAEAKTEGDLSKGCPTGNYVGTLSIKAVPYKIEFAGKQLGDGVALSSFVVHDKAQARLQFRTRTNKANLNLLYPELTSLEVSIGFTSAWKVTGAYPTTPLGDYEGRKRLRWFTRVLPSGGVEDLLSGTQSSSLFWEALPAPTSKPGDLSADRPLVPAWPVIEPKSSYCLPQTLFIPHLDRILSTLGVTLENRSSFIQMWLPSFAQHKFIAYRILPSGHLPQTIAINLIPPPSVLVRVFLLFKGIAEADMKAWDGAGIVEAEMGLDWRGECGWTPDFDNDKLFRAIEYGAMEVFN